MQIGKAAGAAAIWYTLLGCGDAMASTDPVPANPNTGGNFNRYAYVNNNPYRYVDPDGRAARIVHEAGGIRIEMPTRFTGPGVSPENISKVTTGFEGQSGVYNVNGKPTKVDFRITSIDANTPAALQNTVKLFKGKTDHPAGKDVNFADAFGGTSVSLNVESPGFQHGAAQHELNHLGGAKEAYEIGANGTKVPNPARAGDIMNQLPGRMTDIVVQEILAEPNNVHLVK